MTSEMASAPPPTRAPDRQPTATWLAVVRAYNLCDAVMSSRLAAQGVKVVEHEVLAHLGRHPGLMQQALAERVFFAKSHLSGLLGQLEERGLVQRDADPADARVKRLSLTASGQALAARTHAVQQAVVEAMTSGYPLADLQRIESTMLDVCGRLEALLTADRTAAPSSVTPASAPRSRPAPPARRG